MEKKYCNNTKHKEEALLYLCLKQDCSYKERMFCQVCSVSSNHIHDDKQFITFLSQINSESKSQQLVMQWLQDDSLLKNFKDFSQKFEDLINKNLNISLLDDSSPIIRIVFIKF